MDMDAAARLDAALEGRYRVEDKLGEGGMATVYLAEDLRHGRRVALKILKPDLAAVVGSERFLAEIRTTAKLQHPHILPLFDSGEADGFLYYVMPYVEGDSLRQRLERERPLPVDEAVDIAVDVAEALDYAHRQGVVHRDIKPANILMLDGKPVIADFGIALAVGAAGGGRITETGLSLGTPHYMSPEQATGEPHVGAATDVYALGCVLHEMLVGEPPFTGSTPQAVLGKIVTGDRPSARDHRSAVPLHVDAVVRRTLERIPADRFSTAQELADALGDPTFRHGSEEASRRSAGRRDVAVAGWGLAAVLCVALAWSLWSGGGESGEEYFSLLLPSGLDMAAVAQPVAIHPHGDPIYYVVEHADGRREIHVRTLSQPQGLPVPGAGSAAGSIFLSPDGERIAFHDLSTATIRTIPSDGGTAVTVTETGLEEDDAGWGGGAWGPDGTIVFVTMASPHIMTVSAEGGDPVVAVANDSLDFVRYRQPSLLPDGRGVVFTRVATAYPWTQHVAVDRFDDGREPTVLVEGHSPHLTRDGRLLFGRGLPGSGGGELWALQLGPDLLDTMGEPVRLTERLLVSGNIRDRDMTYALADDGTLVYVPGLPSTRNLTWVDRSGDTQPLLTVESPQLPPGVVGFLAPRISPDGGRLAFRASMPGESPSFRIFVMDVARGSLQPLSVDANADWPVWTPDGRRVAFNRFTPGEQDLYWTLADNSEEARPLIPSNPYQQHAGSFSPDGRLLVLQQRAFRNAPDSDLHTFRLGSDEAEPLRATSALEIHPTLSPDGRWLAYVSDESGRPEVYVTDFPDQQGRVKVSREEADQPAWSPVGGELFYRRRDPDDAVMSVSYTSSDSTFQPGIPTLLYESRGRFDACCPWGRSYDVTPDGNRFVMVGIQAGEPVPRVEVIRRWRGAAAR